MSKIEEYDLKFYGTALLYFFLSLMTLGVKNFKALAIGFLFFLRKKAYAFLFIFNNVIPLHNYRCHIHDLELL